MFSPYILWGNVSSQSVTGLCNLYKITQGQGHDLTVIFLHLPQYKMSSPISQSWQMAGSFDYLCHDFDRTMPTVELVRQF